jgi:hypothetical protein
MKAAWQAHTLTAALLLSPVSAQAAAAPVPRAVVMDNPRDAKHPAANRQLLIPSGGVGMNALFFLAAGSGLKPTLLLLHGLPGNEQNLDLAQAIRRAGGPPGAVDLLVRRRRTPSQGQLGRDARRRNVGGAFALRRGADVAGKRVVLVDDVLTTGATVGECARILKRAGAARVDVLTLARAGRETT